MSNTGYVAPEIRIKDAWLLRDNASVYLNELWGEGEPLRSNEEYADIAKQYAEAWAPFHKKILDSMTQLLGLKFRQNIIDVYIAPWFGAFSDPMVIGVTSTPDVFVDTLTHELIHRLLTDNTSVDHEHFMIPDWQKLYGDEHDFNVLIHIPVHAVHKAIYLDVLKDASRFERDSAWGKENDSADYVKAWEYVNNHDYKEIIEDLKKMYENIS